MIPAHAIECRTLAPWQRNLHSQGTHLVQEYALPPVKQASHPHYDDGPLDVLGWVQIWWGVGCLVPQQWRMNGDSSECTPCMLCKALRKAVVAVSNMAQLQACRALLCHAWSPHLGHVREPGSDEQQCQHQQHACSGAGPIEGHSRGAVAAIVKSKVRGRIPAGRRRMYLLSQVHLDTHRRWRWPAASVRPHRCSPRNVRRSRWCCSN